MSAYYNDHEKYVCEWLRNLSASNLIAPGAVDERDVKSVAPEDVRGATQAHFFAGIGVWSYALRLAGVPDDFKVWTASLPCQPFSQAGRGKTVDDERHLWPDFHKLVQECRPQLLVGEQVSSPDGLEWLDAVFADLEGCGYTCGASVLASAWFGAPHIRHRIYWVAHTEEFRWPEGWNARPRDGFDEAWLEFERRGDARGLADAYRARFPWQPGPGEVSGAQAAHSTGLDSVDGAPDGGAAHGVADTVRAGRPEGWTEPREDASSVGGSAEWVADADGGGRRAELGNVRAGQPYDGGSGSDERLADADVQRREGERLQLRERGSEQDLPETAGGGETDGLGDPISKRGGRNAGAVPGTEREGGGGGGGVPTGGLPHQPLDAGAARGLGDACCEGLPEQQRERGVAAAAGLGTEGQAAVRAGTPTAGFWGDAIWLYCRDGTVRPVEPVFEPLAARDTEGMDFVPPLAEGVEGRIGQIKAYGNAINALCAASFIRAFMEATQHRC